MLFIITLDIGRQIQVSLVSLPPPFVPEDESSNSSRSNMATRQNMWSLKQVHLRSSCIHSILKPEIKWDLVAITSTWSWGAQNGVFTTTTRTLGSLGTGWEGQSRSTVRTLPVPEDSLCSRRTQRLQALGTKPQEVGLWQVRILTLRV